MCTYLNTDSNVCIVRTSTLSHLKTVMLSHSLSPQLHLTAPSPLSVTPSRLHHHPPTPKPLPQRPLLSHSRHLLVPLQFLSNIMEAHHLLPNSHSTLLSPLPLNSSSPPVHHHLLQLSRHFLLPPTRVRCLHPAKLQLRKCPSHSSPSPQPSPPSPQHLHLSASPPLAPAHPLLPRGPFHPEHPLLLSLGLFLLLLLLQPHLPLPSTQAPFHPSSSPLYLSHPPITQVHLLLELRCLPLQWLRATTCLLDPCSSLHPSLACREDTLLSRMVRRRPLSRTEMDYSHFSLLLSCFFLPSGAFGQVRGPQPGYAGPYPGQPHYGAPAPAPAPAPPAQKRLDPDAIPSPVSKWKQTCTYTPFITQQHNTYTDF